MNKRSVKNATSPNFSVKQLLQKGQDIGNYIGKPPIYKEISNGFLNTYVKIGKGIPFVRKPQTV